MHLWLHQQDTPYTLKKPKIGKKKEKPERVSRGTKKSSKMSSRPTQAQLNLAALASPSPSPRSKRTLRKIQSYQGLSSNSNSNSTSGQRAHPAAAAAEDLHPTTQQQRQRQLGSPPQFRTQRRVRSNSDAGACDATVAAATQTQRRPARKTGSGVGVKRSVLESYLRDGPQNGDMVDGLQELRYLVLSSRVEADADGMVGFKSLGWFEYYDTDKQLVDIPGLLMARPS